MMHPEILVVVFFVLLTTFGVVRRNRIFFNLGYFLYGLSVFAAEINQYLEIQSFSHLLFAILFLIQAILSVPNKLPYDGGKLAKSAAVKIFSCLALINMIGVLVPYTSPAAHFSTWFGMHWSKSKTGGSTWEYNYHDCGYVKVRNSTDGGNSWAGWSVIPFDFD